MHWHQLEVALVHQHAALTLPGNLCQEMVRQVETFELQPARKGLQG